ncbi:hypothetical protein DN402_29580 [Streptomyces sp. SW4]|nr:hypothetical protein DN402_29580 [Streptomyces sp. SW4]
MVGVGPVRGVRVVVVGVGPAHGERVVVAGARPVSGVRVLLGWVDPARGARAGRVGGVRVAVVRAGLFVVAHGFPFRSRRPIGWTFTLQEAIMCV